jgi:hypothetical protein
VRILKCCRVLILIASRLPSVRFGELGAACPRNRKRDTDQSSRDGVATYVIIDVRFYLSLFLSPKQVCIEGPTNGGVILEVFEGVEPP